MVEFFKRVITAIFISFFIGYAVQAYSHDDDASKQSNYVDTAIANKAAAIIIDNAGADVTIAALRRGG